MRDTSEILSAAMRRNGFVAEPSDLAVVLFWLRKHWSVALYAGIMAAYMWHGVHTRYYGPSDQSIEQRIPGDE